VFAVNVVAPYAITALMPRPARLVYPSSGMNRGADPSLEDAQWERRRWNGAQAYSDSKLFDLWLAFGVGARWPDVRTNTVELGWAPTRMGGPSAPGDLSFAATTQVWLATSNEAAAEVTGQHFYHQKRCATHAQAHSPDHQGALLDYCATLTGTALPR
jgi:hypothetical protein